MLEEFSQLLSAFYAVAENAGLDDCANELLRLLQAVIGFDGAAIANADSPGAGALNIASAHVLGRDPGLLQDYQPLSQSDPIVGAACQGLLRPLVWSCRGLDDNPRRRGLLALARKHEIAQAMVFCNLAAQWPPARWVALFRATNRPFTRADAHYLSLLWPHLAHCIDLNRRLFLQGQVTSGAKGYAVLSPAYLIEAADPTFMRLCHLECGSGIGQRLPANVAGALRRHCQFVGSRIRLSVRALTTCTVCDAVARDVLDLLTPAERVVAALYADGLSHKEISRNLSVSHNTIRTHLSHSFHKLGIHRKTELIQRLASGDH
jgi:DNA-binding CsgD family transcriptional regulator